MANHAAGLHNRQPRLIEPCSRSASAGATGRLPGLCWRASCRYRDSTTGKTGCGEVMRSEACVSAVTPAAAVASVGARSVLVAARGRLVCRYGCGVGVGRVSRLCSGAVVSEAVGVDCAGGGVVIEIRA